MTNRTVRWGESGDQVEPVDAKKDGGSNAGKPEAAEYINWLLARVAAGANLDRKEDLLLHMPLLNSLAIERGIGSATFARSTIGTYIDRYGVVQTAAIDEPRFEVEGYLAEGGSTNEIPNSGDIANVTWNKTQSSVSGSTTGPDNVGGSAKKLVEDNTVGVGHFVRRTSWATPPGDNTLATAYFILKTAGRDWQKVAIRNKVGVSLGAWFNTTNGVVGTVEGGVTASIRSLVNGFYRCTVTIDILSGGSTPDVICYLADADGSINYDGDGTSGAYVYAGQAENLAFATSYILTVGSAVTRTADSLTVDGLENMADVRGPFTVLVDTSTLGHNSNINQFIYELGVSALIISLVWWNNATNTQLNYYDGTSRAIGITQNTLHRLAQRYGGVTSDLFSDGDLVRSGADTPTITAQPTVLHIGENVSGVAQLYGHIRNLRIYDRALTDFEIAVA